MRTIAVIVMTLALAGCFAAQGRNEEAAAKAKATYAQCEELRGIGQLRSHVAAVDCAVRPVLAAYDEAAYPFMDLIYISIQARRLGAANLDAGDVTESQYQHDVAELDARLAAEENRRRESQTFGGNAPPVGADTFIKGLPAFAPTVATGPLPPPGSCLSLGAIRPCK